MTGMRRRAVATGLGATVLAGVVVLAPVSGQGSLVAAARAALNQAPAITNASVTRDNGEPRVSLPSSDTSPTSSPTPEVETCVATTSALSVLNWNIKAGKAWDRANLPAIADAIAGWDPDVVILQEVDRFRPGSGNVDQAAWLGERLGYDHAFGANLNVGGGEYGTAILSRHPIAETSNTPLPNIAGGEPRGLLRAVVEAPFGEVSVYSTHLQHARENAAIRLAQTRVVTEVVSADPHPVVVGGDFNAGPSTEAIAQMGTVLTDSFALAGTGPGPTWPIDGPRARIDYLFHTGLDVTHVQVVGSNASDHLPIHASYEHTTVAPEGCTPPVDPPEGESTGDSGATSPE